MKTSRLQFCVLVFPILVFISACSSVSRQAGEPAKEAQSVSSNIESLSDESANTPSETSETGTAKKTKSSSSSSDEKTGTVASSDTESTSSSTFTGEPYQKVMLDVSAQIQRAWNTCAPTTVSMMLSSQGIEVSQETLALEMGTDETFGTHNANAVAVLNRHLFGYDTPLENQAGYRIETVTSDTDLAQMQLFEERVKRNIAQGYPMYYTFDCARMYPNSYGEHNVIGIGYQLDENGENIEYLYYIDPSYNQQDPVYGGLKKTTVEELFYAMQTCVEPNYAW